MRFQSSSHMHRVNYLYLHAHLSSGPRSVNIGLSIHIPSLCIQSVKALARLRICTGSPEPSLLENVMNTKSHVLAHIFLT